MSKPKMSKPKKMRPVKAWAVVWKEKGGGVPIGHPCCVGLDDKITVPCRCKTHDGWHWIDAMALFSSRLSASAYMERNKSFRIARVIIKEAPHD